MIDASSAGASVGGECDFEITRVGGDAAIAG